MRRAIFTLRDTTNTWHNHSQREAMVRRQLFSIHLVSNNHIFVAVRPSPVQCQSTNRTRDGSEASRDSKTHVATLTGVHRFGVSGAFENITQSYTSERYWWIWHLFPFQALHLLGRGVPFGDFPHMRVTRHCEGIQSSKV